MKPLFEMGQKVKFIGETDIKAGEIIGIVISDRIMYKISSRYYDPETEQIVEGIRTGYEEELEEVENV